MYRLKNYKPNGLWSPRRLLKRLFDEAEKVYQGLTCDGFDDDDEISRAIVSDFVVLKQYNSPYET
jgi:hypothetical protein